MSRLKRWNKELGVLILLTVVGLVVGLWPWAPQVQATGFLSLRLGSTYADTRSIGEVVEERTQDSKTYYLGSGRYSIDSSVGAAHYQDTQGNWQEIDNKFTPAVAPWDWEMLDAGYHIRVKNDFTAGQIIEFEKDGSTVQFQPMALEWTNALSQIQQISMPQSVVPTVTNPEVNLLPNVVGHQGIISWANAYGIGRHFEWEAQPARLVKVLRIDSFSNLPVPEAYIISGGNPVLRLNLIFSPSADVDIYVNGALWDKKTKVQTFDAIRFDKKTGGSLWNFTPLLYWDSEGNQEQSISTLEKSGNDLYVSIRVPYSWLQTAIYPIFIDQTVEVFTTSNRYFHADAWNGDRKWLLDEPDGATSSNSSILLVDSSTGVKYPTTVTTIQETGDDNNWIAPTNVGADDTIYASITAATFDSPDTSYLLRATNLNVGVPAGVTISGILVEIERYYANGLVADYDVCLTKDGSTRVGADRSTGATFPSSPEVTSFGSTADLWETTWTAAEINASTFGVLYKMQATGANSDGFVDFIRVTVYYSSYLVQGFSSEAIIADNLSAGHWGFYLWGSHNGTILAANLFVEVRINSSTGTLLATSTNTPDLTTNETEYYVYLDFPETAWISGDKVWIGIYTNVTIYQGGRRIYFYYDHTSRLSRAVDPVIDINVGASADDGYSDGGANFVANSRLVVGQSAVIIYGSWMRFDGITIPQGSTIDVAHFSVNEYSSKTTQVSNIYADDQNDPDAPVDGADHGGRARTTQFTAWDFNPPTGWNNSTSITNVIQELVTSYDYSNEAIQILWDDDGSVNGQYYYVQAFDTSFAPGLHIEYTEPAGGEPDISGEPSYVSFGLVRSNSTYWSYNTTLGYEPTWPLTDGQATFNLTNLGQSAVNVSINGTNFSGGVGWALSTVQGTDQVVLKAGYTNQGSVNQFVTINGTLQTFITNMASFNTTRWELVMLTPLEYSDGISKNATVLLVASNP